MAYRALYSTQNRTGDATIAASGSAVIDTAKPASRLFDGNPARVCHVTDGGAGSIRITFDFGSAVSIPVCGLVNHDQAAGKTPKIQGNATNSWGAPTLDQTFTAIGAADDDGYLPNAYKDLRSIAHSFRWWSMFFAATASVNLGQLWLGADLTELPHNYSWGYHQGDVRPRAGVRETNAGVEWYYPSIGRRRRLSGEIETTDTGRDAVMTLYRKVRGIERPFLFIPDPNVLDAWLVRSTVDFDYQGTFRNTNPIPLSVLEVARGAALP